ncbi:MAG: S9 family peptidase [Candidatus Methanolliviera hydrocarbonicum]|uniref:S9 family peptidase n=1 Tax=Candidatus Methanolliviera hydrocarbonicum TaxID=2491085 RepID=A0A520KXK5_9EURY|nr:MAG: S9 family peptidase [Candidatus Methanolliviera hydrocarbonicum]
MKKIYLGIIVACIIFTGLIGIVMIKQESTNSIPLEELFSLPTISGLNTSWDKQKIVFYWDKTGSNELYIMDLKTKDIKQVTHGELPKFVELPSIWSHDNSKIVFMKDRMGNEYYDIFLIDIKNGKVSQLTETDEAQDIAVEFSPDDQWITFISTRNGQMNLFKMKSDGSQIIQLTHQEQPAIGGFWQQNGEWIAYCTNEMKNLHNTDIYIVKRDGSEIKRIIRVSKNGSYDFFGSWSPDGKLFSFTSDAHGLNQVGIYAMENGEVKWVGNGLYDESGGEFSQDGKWILCFRNREATIRPILYNIERGECKEINGLPHGTSIARFALDDRLIIGRCSGHPVMPATQFEIGSYNLRNDRYDPLIPAEYGSIDPDIFVESEYIRYKSFDGLEIPALLYHPKIEGKEKLPAIVNPHGGPTFQWSRGFDPIAQFFVSKGYVVLQPNVRGSTGYGVEFRDACMKDWGGKDLKDLVRGAKFLNTLPYVDSNRIGILGGSYGGFLTYLAITKEPSVWNAGAAMRGITDLPTLYESYPPDWKIGLKEQMGDPEKNRELWGDRSAVNFAQNLRSKILIVHGVNDFRCPVQQARMFRDKLLELGYEEGKDFQYVEFEEGHGGWRSNIPLRIQTWKLVGDFFDKNL